MDSIADLRSDLTIARRIIALRIRAQMQYRASFVMNIAGNFIVQFAEVVVLWSLFQKFNDMGGWTIEEVVFLHGLSMVMFSIADTMAEGITYVPTLIREGNFDRTLVRPMSTYIQSLTNDVGLRHLGLTIQGVSLLGIGIAVTDIDWTIGKLVYLPIVIASGAAIFLALFTIEAIVSFWTVNSIEAVNAFTYGGSDLGQYPLHIFQRWLQRLFLWIIPVGFMTYYPALYLLDKPDPLGLPVVAPFLAPLAAVIFCAVIGQAWSFAIRHYRSTGS